MLEGTWTDCFSEALILLTDSSVLLLEVGGRRGNLPGGCWCLALAHGKQKS